MRRTDAELGGMRHLAKVRCPMLSQLLFEGSDIALSILLEVLDGPMRST